MEVDAAIIGGGVVGLACAAAIARGGKSTVVLEKFRALGSVTTSRNSEVIHAGLYYAPGSLKATTCVRGAELLYAWCAARQVPHARCGKLVVATSDGETATLEALEKNAKQNGVEVAIVGADRARSLEPNVRCVAALRSPSTGIVDSHALVASLAADTEAHGGVLAKGRAVVGVERAGDRWTLACEGVAGSERVTAARVVNAAGLWADELAALFGVAIEQRFVKGSYFRSKRALVRSLVYPLPPGDGTLGVHATVDLAGAVRFGPDAEPLPAPARGADGRSREGYAVDEARRAAFHAAVSRYLPEIREDDLEPDTCGIRPKIAGGDFVLLERDGAVHLAGIESPGLTAALALAERVANMIA